MTGYTMSMEMRLEPRVYIDEIREDESEDTAVNRRIRAQILYCGMRYVATSITVGEGRHAWYEETKLRRARPNGEEIGDILWSVPEFHCTGQGFIDYFNRYLGSDERMH